MLTVAVVAAVGGAAAVVGGAAITWMGHLTGHLHHLKTLDDRVTAIENANGR